VYPDGLADLGTAVAEGRTPEQPVVLVGRPGPTSRIYAAGRRAPTPLWRRTLRQGHVSCRHLPGAAEVSGKGHGIILQRKP
jgi:hypothetical protein